MSKEFKSNVDAVRCSASRHLLETMEPAVASSGSTDKDIDIEFRAACLVPFCEDWPLLMNRSDRPSTKKPRTDDALLESDEIRTVYSLAVMVHTLGIAACPWDSKLGSTDVAQMARPMSQLAMEEAMEVMS